MAIFSTFYVCIFLTFLDILIQASFFFKHYGGHKISWWSHWYPGLEFWWHKPFGFKAWMEAWLACFAPGVQWIPHTHLWCDRCRPFGGQHCNGAFFDQCSCLLLACMVELWNLDQACHSTTFLSIQPIPLVIITHLDFKNLIKSNGKLASHLHRIWVFGHKIKSKDH